MASSRSTSGARGTHAELLDSTSCFFALSWATEQLCTVFASEGPVQRGLYFRGTLKTPFVVMAMSSTHLRSLSRRMFDRTRLGRRLASEIGKGGTGPSIPWRATADGIILKCSLAVLLATAKAGSSGKTHSYSLCTSLPSRKWCMMTFPRSWSTSMAEQDVSEEIAKQESEKESDSSLPGSKYSVSASSYSLETGKRRFSEEEEESERSAGSGPSPAAESFDTLNILEAEAGGEGSSIFSSLPSTSSGREAKARSSHARKCAGGTLQTKHNS